MVAAGRRASGQADDDGVGGAGAGGAKSVDGVWRDWCRGKPVAFQWHAARRRYAVSTARHIVAPLIGPDSRTSILAGVLAGAQLWLAHRSRSWSWAALLAASATGGALIAYDLQALCHEMGHHHPITPATTQVPWMSRLSCWWRRFWTSRALSHTIGLISSASTWGPWFSYYFGDGHQHHHAFAGTQNDADDDALFWVWERVPIKALDNPLGSVLWASIASISIPIVYFSSLLACFISMPRANSRELSQAGADFGMKVAVNMLLYRLGDHSIKPAAFLALSSAFSMGLLCHPCITFWLLQHACINPPPHHGMPQCPREMCDVAVAAKRDTAVFHSSAQPTVSYYGSPLWNWLTLNELLHVEHHDFSGVPWTCLPRLTRALPQLYCGEDMLAVHSLYGDVILPWIRKRGSKFDFACRRASMWNVAARYSFCYKVHDRFAAADSPPTRSRSSSNADSSSMTESTSSGRSSMGTACCRTTSTATSTATSTTTSTATSRPTSTSTSTGYDSHTGTTAADEESGGGDIGGSGEHGGSKRRAGGECEDGVRSDSCGREDEDVASPCEQREAQCNVQERGGDRTAAGSSTVQQSSEATAEGDSSISRDGHDGVHSGDGTRDERDNKLETSRMRSAVVWHNYELSSLPQQQNVTWRSRGFLAAFSASADED